MSKPSKAEQRDRKGAGNKQLWKVLNRATVLGAGFAATRGSAVVWRAVTGKKPPISTADPRVRTREAVAWAVVAGAIAELTKVAVNRAAVNYWVRSTGDLPAAVIKDIEKATDKR